MKRLGILVFCVLFLAGCGKIAPNDNTEKGTLQALAGFVQTQKLFGSGVSYSRFGGGVSVDGSRLVVGCDCFSEGIAGYVFERATSGQWVRLKSLSINKPVGTYSGPVAISGDTIVIGVYGETVGANLDQGSAYIFQRNQGGLNNWGLVKRLTASDGSTGDLFGNSVSINGDNIVIGAIRNDISNKQDQGSAYIFQRNQGGTNRWGLVKRLIASDGVAYDEFGSVAINGDTIVVGSNSGQVGSNYYQGSAYIFQRNQGGLNNWGQVKKLIANDGSDGDSFGSTVSVNGDTVVLGSPNDSIDSKSSQGSAYVFQRNQGGINNWGQVKKLIASNGAIFDTFGYASVNGDTIIVGSPGSDVAGNSFRGSAYIFQRNQGGINNWGEVKQIISTDTSSAGISGAFGVATSISGNTILVGAPDTYYPAKGAAYTFEYR